MRSLGYSSITELPLVNGRRADIVSVAPDGGICIVEVKSCVADFRADRKWLDYLDYCDRFYSLSMQPCPRASFPKMSV